ncbi:hypothetical protein DL98DRAFT_140907 [Cadophora sp. DSE1049]|nr:hypothetical protein DL98DRAFT_140907 [Cadophora sp. DSE1049]
MLLVVCEKGLEPTGESQMRRMQKWRLYRIVLDVGLNLFSQPRAISAAYSTFPVHEPQFDRTSKPGSGGRLHSRFVTLLLTGGSSIQGLLNRRCLPIFLFLPLPFLPLLPVLAAFILAGHTRFNTHVLGRNLILETVLATSILCRHPEGRI